MEKAGIKEKIKSFMLGRRWIKPLIVIVVVIMSVIMLMLMVMFMIVVVIMVMFVVVIMLMVVVVIMLMVVVMMMAAAVSIMIVMVLRFMLGMSLFCLLRQHFQLKACDILHRAEYLRTFQRIPRSCDNMRLFIKSAYHLYCLCQFVLPYIL